MKYFFDTEFIEGFKKPMFSKSRHFIDLISIGIVCEDGREYYAISTEFDEDDADEWVKKNVISPLYDINGQRKNASQWKPNVRIAQEIKQFVYAPFINKYEQFITDDMTIGNIIELQDKIEFYAYFADYDWVLLCSLFGRMIDLPKGFPMYCTDLKQMMDERTLDGSWKRKYCPESRKAHHALVDAKWNQLLYNKLKTIKPK